MWRQATLLPAGTQVGCCLLPVLLTSVPSAVAPISAGSTDESAVLSPEAGCSPGVGERERLPVHVSCSVCPALGQYYSAMLVHVLSTILRKGE